MAMDDQASRATGPTIAELTERCRLLEAELVETRLARDEARALAMQAEKRFGEGLVADLRELSRRARAEFESKRWSGDAAVEALPHHASAYDFIAFQIGRYLERLGAPPAEAAQAQAAGSAPAAVEKAPVAAEKAPAAVEKAPAAVEKAPAVEKAAAAEARPSLMGDQVSKPPRALSRYDLIDVD